MQRRLGNGLEQQRLGQCGNLITRLMLYAAIILTALRLLATRSTVVPTTNVGMRANRG